MLTIAAASTIPDAQTQTNGPKGCKKKKKKKKVSYIFKAIGKKKKKYLILAQYDSGRLTNESRDSSFLKLWSRMNSYRKIGRSREIIPIKFTKMKTFSCSKV